MSRTFWGLNPLLRFCRYGYNVLWLPPYHPDINPIEEAWGIGKGHVGLENDGSNPFEQVKKLLMDGFKKVSDLWPKLVRRTCQKEMKYIKKDRIDILQDHDGSWEVDVDESSSSESEDDEEVSELFA